MIDIYLQRMYAVLIVLISTMTMLIGLLFFEYRFYCRQAQELTVLKEYYYTCINDEQKDNGNGIDGFSQDIQPSQILELDNENSMTDEEISIAQASDDPDDDDDYVDESFVVINRQPEYLNESAIDYLHAQGFDGTRTALDIEQWVSYSNKKTVPVKESIKRAVHSVNPQKKLPSVVVRKPIKDFGFIWPIEKDKFWLSSLFGPRKRTNGTWGFHHGIDMAAIKGTGAKAAREGKVVEACFQAGYGNTVVVQHTEKIKTRYAHLNAIYVRVGQAVSQGAVVGTVGETGFIRKKGKDGSHLHFEVYEAGKRINPLDCLPRMS